MDRSFEINELVRVAKRENNTKRSYLYVNPIQGKHIPVAPSVALDLFKQMAGRLQDRYKDKKLLVIGFAETATAIGSAIAYQAKNVKYYMNTTREDVLGAEYLFFSESHSHATEQRLVKNKLDEVIADVDSIVFAEDEVTTGNTIEKLIRVLSDEFDCSKCQFGIISILNSMSDDRMAGLRSRGIECDFIQKIPSQYRIEEIERYTYKPLETDIDTGVVGDYQRIFIENYWNSRIVENISSVKKRVNQFAKEIVAQMVWKNNQQTILIVGTEEFMFPAMLAGELIEEKFPEAEVRFHATTRSPIEISDGDGYPLYTRYPLISLYEKKRHTFIYNLKKYDHVILMTDAEPINELGLNSLLRALEVAGNNAITIVQWRDE